MVKVKSNSDNVYYNIPLLEMSKLCVYLNMKKTIGEQIKEARLAKGYKNQAQLAVKLNMSVDTISGLESGRKKSTKLTILQLIGEELGITFEI